MVLGPGAGRAPLDGALDGAGPRAGPRAGPSERRWLSCQVEGGIRGDGAEG